MPRPSPSPFPTNRPNFFVEPSTTIESLRNSSTRCEPLASRCSSTPSKDPLVEKEEYHPKCALSSRHSRLTRRLTPLLTYILHNANADRFLTLIAALKQPTSKAQSTNRGFIPQ